VYSGAVVFECIGFAVPIGIPWESPRDLSSLQHSNGSTGSTTVDFSNRSAAYHLQHLSKSTIVVTNHTPWRHCSYSGVSGIAGAVEHGGTQSLPNGATSCADNLTPGRDSQAHGRAGGCIKSRRLSLTPSPILPMDYERRRELVTQMDQMSLR
jgi:hypothetical protein